jgi:hypothetical protein
VPGPSPLSRSVVELLQARTLFVGALGRIRTCDTRFRKPALNSGPQRPENANRHRVFAFSRFGAFRCSVFRGISTGNKSLL